MNHYCFECRGDGQVGICRDGTPQVCPACGGTGREPKPRLVSDMGTWNEPAWLAFLERNA